MARPRMLYNEFSTAVVARLPADKTSLVLIHAAEQANPDQHSIVRDVLD
jgi:hypothetical protein